MVLGSQIKQSGATKPSALEHEAFEYDLFAHRFTEIPSNMKMRVEYSGSNAIYVGYAPKGLAEGTDGWLFQKLSYSGSNCTEINIAYGNWTARAGYSYD